MSFALSILTFHALGGPQGCPLWVPLMGMGICCALLLAQHRGWVPRERRRIRFAAAILLMCTLAILGSNRRQSRLHVVPRIVRIECEVSGPGYPRGDQGRFPIGKGMWVEGPHLMSGPLPGTRLQIIGRLEPNGRTIRVTGPESLRIIRRPSPGHLGATFERLRRHLRERLKRSTDNSTGGLLCALLLGDRSLPYGERQLLVQTGVLHLFAISGLHLGLILMGLRRVLGRKGVVILTLLALYAGLTGFRAPMGRALFLATSSMMAVRLVRPPSRLPHLFLVAASLVTLKPELFHSPGFLLSFLACTGMLLISAPLLDHQRNDPIERWLDRYRGSVRAMMALMRNALLVGMAASSATSLVGAWFFHRVTPIGVVASILLSPLVPILLALGALKLAMPDHPAVVQLAEWGCDLLLLVARQCARIPLASISVPAPGAFVIVQWCALMTTAAVLARRNRMRMTLLTLAATQAILMVSPPGQPRGFHLLDAGRGAALYQGSASSQLLWDTGPRTARVADQLLHLGVDNLEGLVLTHEHEDHAGAVPEVLARLGQMPLRAPFAGTPTRCARGDILFACSRVLWPPAGAQAPNPNDLSLAAVLVAPRERLLLTGDLEGPGMWGLLSYGDELSADILLLPHHGARQPYLLALLARSSPGRSWLPARAGFPSEDLLKLSWWNVRLEATWLGRPICSDRPTVSM